MARRRRSLLDPEGVSSFGIQPFGSALRPGASFPASTDEEFAQTGTSLLGGGLSGLAYVGSILDKAFGGRAIRGALGGRPRELLSILPFSDTLGLTDFTQRVSGDDILTGKGLLPQLIAENDPERTQLRDFAGPAFEIATDPLSYLVPFARTPAGLAAVKDATAVKGIGAGIRAGERALLGVGLPFRHPSALFGSAETTLGGRPVVEGVEAIGRGLTRIGNARIPGTSFYPIPALRSVFDYRTFGVPHPEVQRAAVQVGTPSLEAAEVASRRAEAELRHLAEPLLTSGGTVDESLRIRGIGEGHPGYVGTGDPLEPVAQKLAQLDRERLLRQHGAGVNTPDRPGHIARSIDLDAQRLEGRSSPYGFPGTAVIQRARKAALDLPGQTPTVERLIADPSISGAGSILRDPRERTAYVLRSLLSEPQAGLTPEAITGIVAESPTKVLKKLARQLDPSLTPAQLADPDFLRAHLAGGEYRPILPDAPAAHPEIPAPVPPPVAPAAPPAVVPPTQVPVSASSVAQRIERAFAEADLASGGENFVTLAELRARLPDVPATDFEAAIHDLRQQGRLSLDTHEGTRQALTPAMRAAGITQAGSEFIYASRKADDFGTAALARSAQPAAPLPALAPIPTPESVRSVEGLRGLREGSSLLDPAEIDRLLNEGLGGLSAREVEAIGKEFLGALPVRGKGRVIDLVRKTIHDFRESQDRISGILEDATSAVARYRPPVAEVPVPAEVPRAQPQVVTGPTYGPPVQLPGVLTPEALREGLGGLTPSQQLRLFGKKSPLNELRRRAGQFAKYAGNLPDRYAREGVPFFTPDVFADFRRAEGVANIQNAVARTAIETLGGTSVRGGQLARPVAELRDAGTPFATLNQAIQKAFGGKARNVTEEVLDEAGKVESYIHSGVRQEIAQRLGIDTSGLSASELKKTFDRYGVPRDVAQALKGLKQPFVTPRELNPFIDVFGQANSLFRGLVYPLFPGSHVRNFTGAEVNNLLSGALYPEGNILQRAFGPLQDAGRVVRGELPQRALEGLQGATPAEQLQSLYTELYAQGVALRPQTLQEGLSPGRTAGRLFALPPGQRPTGNPLAGTSLNPFDIAGVGGRETTGFLPAAAGNVLGSGIENRVRIAQYLGLRAQGYTSEAAARVVEATHFDYSRLAPAEKFLKNTFVPFYTFTRRNLPRQLQLFAENPSQIATPLRALSSLRGSSFVPPYLGGGAVIPLGQEQDGTQRYVGTLGLPIEEAFERVRQDPLTGVVGGTAESYAGLLSPYVRTPIELLTNRQLFSGRQLSDLRPYGLATGYGLLAPNNPQAQVLSQAIAASPLSRIVGTVDKLIDARKGLVPKLLNLGTGVRVTDVDVEAARAIEVRRRLEQALRSAPNVSTLTQFYVPPELAGQVDPQTAILLRAFARAREEARAASQARRSAR